MKKLSLSLLLLWALQSLSAQSTEFPIYENGLMYDSTTMSQLTFIVDSLNVKFRSCDLHKTYYARRQGRAHYFHLKTNQPAKVARALNAGLNFEEFVEQYPQATVLRHMIVSPSTYLNYQDEEMTRFHGISIRERGGEKSLLFKKISFSDDQNLEGNWLHSHLSSENKGDDYIKGFYFVEGLRTPLLYEPYARMIQYSDCMVDTSTQIFYEDAREGFVVSEEGGTVVDRFVSYINRVTDRPDYKDFKDDYEAYYQAISDWEIKSVQQIDQELLHTKKFQNMLSQALAEARRLNYSTSEFEAYIARYHSKAAALDLKRSRIVYGQCSQDQSPRYHALEIAVLSAETANWEVFLRAHLDIMNDYFQRATDGSYAWAARKTYIRELEELDIKVLDLMLGISLRLDNPSQNHYFGSIPRVGRALSETKDPARVETQLLTMIQDENLDDFNRVVIYYLYRNYLSYLENETLQAEKLKALETAVQQLPDYLKENYISPKKD